MKCFGTKPIELHSKWPTNLAVGFKYGKFFQLNILAKVIELKIHTTYKLKFRIEEITNSGHPQLCQNYRIMNRNNVNYNQI